MPESNFITRLLEEKQQVEERVKKLHSFIFSENFKSIDAVQQSLLNIQYGAMITYNQCLQERINWLKQTSS